MSENDIKKLLAALSLNYPATYRDMRKEDKITLVRLWMDAFGNLDTEIVWQALRNYIKTNKYPPNIAGMQEQIDLLTARDNTDELWQALMKAIRNSGRDARAEFERLPEECKTFVGSPAELRALGNTDLTTVNTVTRGQFYKRVEVIQARDKAREQLPEQVQRALNKVPRIGGKNDIPSRR
ncbi:hypothetical protein LI177_02790 [bacterium 210820-DFI.6.37]|nr:hypothetical protein [bacterium 210820-DFI.6.37]